MLTPCETASLARAIPGARITSSELQTPKVRPLARTAALPCACRRIETIASLNTVPLHSNARSPVPTLTWSQVLLPSGAAIGGAGALATPVGPASGAQQARAPLLYSPPLPTLHHPPPRSPAAGCPPRAIGYVV